MCLLVKMNCMCTCVVSCSDLQHSQVHISLQFRPVLSDVSAAGSCKHKFQTQCSTHFGSIVLLAGAYHAEAGLPAWGSTPGLVGVLMCQQ